MYPFIGKVSTNRYLTRFESILLFIMAVTLDFIGFVWFLHYKNSEVNHDYYPYFFNKRVT